MKSTSKYSDKLYRCNNCGHQRMIGTNHFGECYLRCPNCSWRTCKSFQVHTCMEPVPEGMGIPEPWKIVTLGKIAEII